MFNFLKRPKADFERAELLAWDTLRKSKTSYPPVCAAEIAQQNGIKVEIARLKQEYRQTIAGIIDPASGIIVVNTEDSISRRNFTVAHCLGHIILEHDIKSPEYNIVFRHAEKRWIKSPMEQEADYFAASLLVPMDKLRGLLEMGPNLPNCYFALYFGVVEGAIKWRRKYA